MEAMKEAMKEDAKFCSMIDPDGSGSANDAINCLAWLVRGYSIASASIISDIRDGGVPNKDDADSLAYYLDKSGEWIALELQTVAERLGNESNQ